MTEHSWQELVALLYKMCWTCVSSTVTFTRLKWLTLKVACIPLHTQWEKSSSNETSFEISPHTDPVHNFGEIDRNLADCGVNTWIYDLNTFVLLTLSGPPVTLPWPPFQHYSHPYIVNIMTTHISQIMLPLEKKWLVITHHSLDYGSCSLRNST